MNNLSPYLKPIKWLFVPTLVLYLIISFIKLDFLYLPLMLLSKQEPLIRILVMIAEVLWYYYLYRKMNNNA